MKHIGEVFNRKPRKFPLQLGDVRSMSPIPVTIVTGFLGSGKTTLINKILRDPAFAETAVLINEFGNVQIDHDLVAEFSDELVMTTTGCLCCTASSDIKKSLEELWTKRRDGTIAPFRRVIVETTGLMDPIPVIVALISSVPHHQSGEIVGREFVLTQIMTLFDIVNGARTLDNHDEAVKQVALADVVALTKSDLAHDPASLKDIKRDQARLSTINPGAIVLDRQRDWPIVRDHLRRSGTYDLRGKGEDASGWLKAEQIHASEHHEHEHTHSHVNRHGDDIQSHVIVVDEPVSPVVFSFFIDAIKMIAGTDLLRLKGIVSLSDDPDHPVVVHGVQHLIHPVTRLESWPRNDKRSKIVIIGRNLQIAVLRNILQPNSLPEQSD